MKAPKVKAKVNRGAALLNKEFPDWHKKVKIEKLDIDNGMYCIVGQLFNTDYYAGLTELGIQDDEQSYGFVSSDNPYSYVLDGAKHEEFEELMNKTLNEAWKDKIRELRGKK